MITMNIFIASVQRERERDRALYLHSIVLNAILILNNINNPHGNSNFLDFILLFYLLKKNIIYYIYHLLIDLVSQIR
jgi:hypothetical protein